MIPGFTSTGSKRPEALYGLSEAEAVAAGLPVRMVRSSGCTVWDDRGEEYLDFHMGLGAVALGYGHEAVTRAAVHAAEFGLVGPLAPVEETRVAERLRAVIPWMEQVRFLKTGAEAVAAAVRIARVHTGRERVLGCGYHGWLDWANPSDPGVPKAVGGLFGQVPFNDPEEARKLIRKTGDRLAAVVIEPVVDAEPGQEWLVALREETERTGAVLVFDEVKTALRIAMGGAGERYGVRPDLAVVGKALANGFPLAAVGGSAGVMQAAADTWISSTLATEGVSLAAADATLQAAEACGLPEHLGRVGAMLFGELLLVRADFPDAVAAVRGMPEMCHLEYADEATSRDITAAMAEERVLFKRTAYNYVSLSHGQAEVQRLVEVLRGALEARRR